MILLVMTDENREFSLACISMDPGTTYSGDFGRSYTTYLGNLAFQRDILGGFELNNARHTRGITRFQRDILGGSGHLKVRHTWGKRPDFHDILGGKRAIFATYLGRKT